MNSQSEEDLIDAILDLEHDLGKHIRLPIAMLPEGAGDAELRETLLRALGSTRHGPSGTRSARSIWGAFEAEFGGALGARGTFDRLCRAVEGALAWEERAAGGAPLDRAAVTRDLGAVGEAIRSLRDEVTRGR